MATDKSAIGRQASGEGPGRELPLLRTLPSILDQHVSGDPSERLREVRDFYDSVTAQLDSTRFGVYSYFLNYGYEPNGEPESAAVSLPDNYVNKASVKLILEVIGDCPVSGERILDVGCGRGGAIYVLKRFFTPGHVVGIDLSGAAVAFSKRVHTYSTTSFCEGDAGKLPFADNAFDIVTSIESSHNFENLRNFYSEACRVLVPGGYFLYADLFAVKELAGISTQLLDAGFTPVLERDITNNVIRSCAREAARRLRVFDSRNDRETIENFLAVPGSRNYQQMGNGRWSYRIFQLRKQ